MKIGVWAPNAAFDPETKKISTGLKLDVDIIKHYCQKKDFEFGICNEDSYDFDVVFSLEKTPPKKIIKLIKSMQGKIAWCVNTDLLSVYPGCIAKSGEIDYYIGKTVGQTEYLKSLGWSGEVCLINWASPFFEPRANAPIVDRNSLIHFAGSSLFKNSMEQLRAGIKLVEMGYFDEMFLKLSSHKTSVIETIERMKKLTKDHPKVHIIDSFLTEDEKTELYLKCRVALCASAREGFGHYILEAANHGCQVVTTDGYPMSELLYKQVYLAKSTRKTPEDNSLWGYRYECKEDAIIEATLKAKQDDHIPTDALVNVRSRLRLFEDDMYLFFEKIPERKIESAWEMF